MCSDIMVPHISVLIYLFYMLSSFWILCRHMNGLWRHQSTCLVWRQMKHRRLNRLYRSWSAYSSIWWPTHPLLTITSRRWCNWLANWTMRRWSSRQRQAAHCIFVGNLFLKSMCPFYTCQWKNVHKTIILELRLNLLSFGSCFYFLLQVNRI